MARKRQKKSLYEVIGQGHFKSLPNKSLEKHRMVFTEPQAPEKPPEAPKKADKWPSRPKMIEAIDGRVEFSMPYTILIAAGLALILVFLVFFRLGQFYEQRRTQGFEAGIGGAGAGGSEQIESRPEGSDLTGQQQPVTEDRAGSQNAGTQIDPDAGSNRIVIMQYRMERDLIPAMEFFNSKGIETEIIQRGEVFFLVTKKNTYRNPNRAGTDGAIALQRIKDIGSGYEPPEAGYEKFNFDTAYPERAD